MDSNKTVSDYHAAVLLKVTASRNLHELLPKELDFFILLSSSSGVAGIIGIALAIPTKMLLLITECQQVSK